MRFRKPLSDDSVLNKIPLDSLIRVAFDRHDKTNFVLSIPDSNRVHKPFHGEDRGTFIEAMLQGVPVGEFVLGGRDGSRSTVIDGAARLYAIRDFMDDDFPVPTPSGPIYFSEFDATERRHFDGIMVSVWRYSGLSAVQASDLRSNNGKIQPI